MRQVLDEIDRYLKPAVAALVVLGVLSVADATTISAIQQAGVGGSLLALISAGGVYVVGGWRRTLYNFLTATTPSSRAAATECWLSRFCSACCRSSA